jgi:hypothetical protein
MATTTKPRKGRRYYVHAPTGYAGRSLVYVGASKGHWIFAPLSSVDTIFVPKGTTIERTGA